MEEDLIIRGLMEESALPELLRSMSKNKETGELTCYVGDHIKTIYIQDGQILFATSTNYDDRLGESLLRYGKISIRNFVDASSHVHPGKRLGEILCESNAITPEELVDGVKTQVRDIILSLFAVTEGRYELFLKDIDSQDMIHLNEGTEELIFAGVKSIQSWSRISRGIGSLTSKFLPAADSEKVLFNMTLTPEESHVYSLCQRGQFNVEEICGMSFVSNFETCRILWALLMVGALESYESAVENTSESTLSASINAESDLHDLVENYNDLYSHVYDYAAQRLGGEAKDLFEKAMLHVQDAIPNITKGLRLDIYGRLDFDSILRNLVPIPENGRMDLVAGALEEIVYALLYEVGVYFGPVDQRRLTQEIQELRKH